MRLLLFYLSSFLLFACGGEPFRLPQGLSPQKHEIAHRELHIGEYLKKTSDEKLLTVVRDQTSFYKGLVVFDPDSKEIVVVDSEARQAKDIYTSNESIAYRKKESLHIIHSWSKWDREIPIGSLNAYSFKKGTHQLFFVDEIGVPSRICITEDFEILEDSHSYLRVLHIHENDLMIYVLNNSLFYLPLNDCRMNQADGTLIAEEVGSRYIDSIEIEDQLLVAFMDENTGELKLAREQQDGSFSTEVVDGKALKTLVGMDIDMIEWESQPVLVYLDAWNLKMRVAVFKDGSWNSDFVDLPGAMGFYNQILEIRGSKMRVGFHAFRNLVDRRNHFENLNIVEIDLDEL